ncbi:MAG: UDP-N-acetylglucosamine 2-epimerase [Deltaproteobacteria bacterium]
MRRKIAVITGARSEYDLLYWTMKEILKAKKLQLQLIVTGSHLSEKFGNTYNVIERDGFIIDKKVDMLLSGDTPLDVASSMGRGTIGFAETYDKLKPDIILVLGDRFEILAAVSAALPFGIPIAHISGGEITQCAMDNQIRHAITKIAHIHFAGGDIYADNIRKMGEENWRIFQVGEPGLENIKKSIFIDREILFKELKIDSNKKTFLATLHPTTLNSREQEEQESKLFFKVLKEYEDVNIVVTYPNSDTNGERIINEIKKIGRVQNVRVFKSLGREKYLSLMKESDLILGNSSSGLIEGPIFKKPVIDYGDRQKGRLKAQNVIHVNANAEEFRKAIQKALYSEEFRKMIAEAKSFYSDGETSKEIVKVFESISLDKNLIEKKFIAEEKKNE